ncbi:hypothetical protein OHA40_26210 [Nocardia sp. NBC_00508]|uniref:hypothetical protein n=1 Tax=Nocardia sp. NBC_00508 TaxID=2975992 RepID=UPI002E8201A5|nr:hypothetical protein [Nocardia sp. NBC_00508]WUD65118.1 hypothetical protein OHA40_26210 [Nocardia sp. NBC_00508]
MTSEPACPARPSRRRVALLAVGAALAASGAATRPFSWPANALVVVLVVVVAVLAWRVRPVRTRPTARLRRGAAVWSTLLVAAALWEGYAFARQPEWTRPSDEHPTLSTLLDPALEQWPLRIAGWLVWLGVGWWLVSK